MTTELTPRDLPTDPKTGLTLPLSKLLGSQELSKHKAMVAVELEVLAKKMDRFGWERDRGSMAHDRMMMDWMDALCDFPLSEVQEACREWVCTSPRKMPNEGDIRQILLAKRAAAVGALPRQPSPERPPRVSAARATELMAQAGFQPKRMDAAE